MNNVSFNSIAFCVLSTGLIVLGLNILAEGLFHVDKPERPGMVVEVAEAATAPDETEEEKVSVTALLASADVAKGQKEFAKCVACHTPEKGGSNKIGPNLWNIVNAKIAAHADFSYSEALTSKSEEPWSYEALDGFIERPRQWAPGTKMSFGGIRSPEKRADLIAYLRSLSDDPAPLPSQSTEAGGADEPAQSTE